ncbi:hypothetical protein PFNF54_03372 [Plasmodium falciparum NF54]|uniref:Uncharacterized protein n=1 Tax=Plasmodium falciparum (isolate NF54) TaxID=5843 RepID=W7JS44_PLAFO|nr:hypothetical protein PFNF54_03372 [Plasmodium falciparum NF54]
MLKYNINKTYGMQRVKKGEHNSWGMKKGIEPYGKQFFVFNAFKRDIKFDNEMSTSVTPLLNSNNEKIASETVLCVCDFAKRPLMFLNYLDFKILVK